MSWGITKVGSPTAVAEAFRARVEKVKESNNDTCKGILEGHATAVESFVAGLTSPENAEYPRQMIVESSGHVESSSGQFKLEARVVYG